MKREETVFAARARARAQKRTLNSSSNSSVAFQFQNDETYQSSYAGMYGWKCLQWTGNSVFICIQKGLPPRLPGHVVVRMRAWGVCQADRRAVLGLKETPNVPCLIPGHEGIGVVVWTDRGHSQLLGQKVVILPHVHPPNHHLSCEAYAKGDWHLCEHSKHMGFGIDGTFAEYFSVPVANVQPILLEIQRKASEATLDFGLHGDVILVLIEPLACVKTAIDALSKSIRKYQRDETKEDSLGSGRRALLIGCGVMSGIWAIELFKLGYEISLYDKNLDRAGLLDHQLAIARVRSEIWIPKQRKDNFDLVVVNASNASASLDAYKYVKDNGVVYLFSGINNAEELDILDPNRCLKLEPIHRKGYSYCGTQRDGRNVITCGSSGYSREAFNSAIRDVGDYALSFTRLITGIIYDLDGHKVRSLVPSVPDFDNSKPVLPIVLGDWKGAARHLKIVAIVSRNEPDIFIEATVKSVQVVSQRSQQGSTDFV